MEIKGSIRQLDLDTKVGRIRKFGGDRVSASFKNFTHKELVKLMKAEEVVFSGFMNKGLFNVEKVE